jgi:hypothetical protein
VSQTVDADLLTAAQRLRASLASREAAPALIARWRAETALLAALPPRYGEVLESLLTRFESAAAFGEESCSFSVSDLTDQLSLWLDKAERQLPR